MTASIYTVCSKCWTVDIDTQNGAQGPRCAAPARRSLMRSQRLRARPIPPLAVLFRCLWKLSRQTTTTATCISPNDTSIPADSEQCATKQTVRAQLAGSGVQCRVSRRLPVAVVAPPPPPPPLPQTTTTQEEAPANDAALVRQLNTFAAIASSLMGDVDKAKWVILAMGGGGAMLAGLLYILLMRKFAGCIVWTLLYSLLTASLLFTLYCFNRAGKLKLRTCGGRLAFARRGAG